MGVRLRATDVLRLGLLGLTTRKVRAALSALGIALGIATMVAVAGVSESSRSDLMHELDRLGTNLVYAEVAQEAKDANGNPTQLPATSAQRVLRIGAVEGAGTLGSVDAQAYRSKVVPASRQAGVITFAADADLLRTLRSRVAQGHWFNSASQVLPTAVLGPKAAARLGVGSTGQLILLGHQYFTVIGILDHTDLFPTLDQAVLVGYPASTTYLYGSGRPSIVFVRTADKWVNEVRVILARTVMPGRDSEVVVSRPSDALVAKTKTDQNLTMMMLGLGAVALLVGAIGVANTMVISVLERRSEIGLRKALGSTAGTIRIQFLTESVALTGIGALVGSLLGVAGTTAFALANHWTPTIPTWAVPTAVISALGVGALAGLYPAMRAARIPPSQALSS